MKIMAVCQKCGMIWDIDEIPTKSIKCDCGNRKIKLRYANSENLPESDRLRNFYRIVAESTRTK